MTLDKKKQIATTIEDSIYDALKLKAARENTSVSALIREACIKAAGLSPSPMEVAAMYSEITRLRDELEKALKASASIPATNNAAKESVKETAKKVTK